LHHGLLGAEDPSVYVKQHITDPYGLRHGKRKRRVDDPDQLSALEELYLHRGLSDSGLRWRMRVQWELIADELDARTADELRQILDGATVKEMGAKNYKHFQRSLPRIGAIAYQKRINPAVGAGLLEQSQDASRHVPEVEPIEQPLPPPGFDSDGSPKITDARPGMPVMPVTPEWLRSMGYEVFSSIAPGRGRPTSEPSTIRR
jgi:hypothetical protein